MPNVSFCEDNRDVHYNPYVEPPFFCKLTLNDGSVVNIEDTVGNGVLDDTTSQHQYSETCVGAEIGTLCSELGLFAFTNFSGLTNIEIPSSVTTIGQAVFADCTNLSSLTIPSNVTSITGGNITESCTSLTTITVDSGNTVYDSRNNCNAIIEKSTNKLIVGCQTTVIPNSVTRIGNCAFYGQSGLTSITFPSGVTYIEMETFADCARLANITSLAQTAPTIEEYTFAYNFPSNGTLYVPNGSSGYDAWLQQLGSGWNLVEI